MHYFVEDLNGLAAATLLALFVIVLPGFGLAELMRRARLVGGDVLERACWGLVLGPIVPTAVDALLLRWIGFVAVLLPHLALAAVGLRPAGDVIRRIPKRWWVVVFAGWLLVAWTNVDFDWNGRLYQPLTVIDGVKHAAVVGSLAQHGVPLHDPFFARSGVAGYYYYFYIAAALIHWIGGALIDSRAAFAADTFATLLAFPAVLILLAKRAALIPEGAQSRFVTLIILLCCVSGFDVLPALWIWVNSGYLIPQADWWSEEVRWGLTSVLMAPHHMTAVIAIFTGCLVLAEAEPRLIVRVGIAGAAFATAFGCSVWIALAAVPILLIWWIYDFGSPASRPVWALPLGGTIALLLSLPQIGDIHAGRTITGPPLVFAMRPVGPVRVLPHSVSEWVVHLAVTPGGYLIEFGIFALGAIAFLSRGGLATSRSTSLGKLLLVSAPVALVMVTFIRSAVIYNDFGWRAVWFAELPALLWTAALLTGPPTLHRSFVWTAALVLGISSALWDLAGLRLIRPYYPLIFVNGHPDVDYDARGAYQWIDGHLRANVIVQHNPARARRALDFGPYSDHPVAVADGEAQLFGADPISIQKRIALLQPIFERPMPTSELRQRASAAGVGAILLLSDDPIWRTDGGPPRDWACGYRSPHSCVMLLEHPR